MFNIVRFPYESDSAAVKPQRQEGSLLGRIVSWVKNLVGFFTAKKVDEAVKAIFTNQPEKSNLKKTGPDALSSEPKKAVFPERESATTKYVVKSRKVPKKVPYPYIRKGGKRWVPPLEADDSVPRYLLRPQPDFDKNYRQVCRSHALYTWYANNGDEKDKEIALDSLSVIKENQESYKKELLESLDYYRECFKSAQCSGDASVKDWAERWFNFYNQKLETVQSNPF